MFAEDDFIQQLSEVPSVRGFLALSTNEFTKQISLLIERVFRKQNFALESVVNSLFEHQGPLADFSVRLKLLLGLGIVSSEVYEDINHVLEMKTKISDEIEEHPFSSQCVMDFAGKLHHADLTQLHELIPIQPSFEDEDSVQLKIQQYRLEKMVRAVLILAITQIIEKLSVESPI